MSPSPCSHCARRHSDFSPSASDIANGFVLTSRESTAAKNSGIPTRFGRPENGMSSIQNVCWLPLRRPPKATGTFCSRHFGPSCWYPSHRDRPWTQGGSRADTVWCNVWCSDCRECRARCSSPLEPSELTVAPPLLMSVANARTPPVSLSALPPFSWATRSPGHLFYYSAGMFACFWEDNVCSGPCGCTAQIVPRK